MTKYRTKVNISSLFSRQGQSDIINRLIILTASTNRWTRKWTDIDLGMGKTDSTMPSQRRENAFTKEQLWFRQYLMQLTPQHQTMNKRCTLYCLFLPLMKKTHWPTIVIIIRERQGTQNQWSTQSAIWLQSIGQTSKARKPQFFIFSTQKAATKPLLYCIRVRACH